MKKTVISLVLIAGTLLTSAIMMADGKDTPVTPTIVTTQRRDVYKTIGLLGQLAYADEEIIFSAYTGIIDEVNISSGDRLAAGSILASYEPNYQEELATIYADYGVHVSDDANALLQEAVNQTVLRTTRNCTVRDVYIQQGTSVTAGMPIARLSGTSQLLRCTAAKADAENIQPDMWAWILYQGKEYGFARVESVERINDAAYTNTTQYLVTLIPEQHIALEEASTLDVSIYLSGSSDVVSLPVEAITERETVWWVNDEGRCTEIPAEIVLCDESYAWVNLPEGIDVAVGEFVEGQKVTGAAV